MEISDILQQINEKLDFLKNKIDNKEDDSFFHLLQCMVHSPIFPEAVDPSLICDLSNEDEKAERATNIIEIYIEEFLENKSFLDFGCGEGHTAFATLDKKTKISKGYDIKSELFSKKITNANPDLLTNNWDDVSKNKYDVVLMYDVFDHLENEDPADVMKKIKSVLTPEGKIYARMHPFISRHANHYYHTLNKAFLHLIFTEDELEKITGVKPNTHTNKVFYPFATYTTIFNKTKIKIISQNIIENEVEPYFKDNKAIMNRIMSRFNFTDPPLKQMAMSFIDFVLK